MHLALKKFESHLNHKFSALETFSIADIQIFFGITIVQQTTNLHLENYHKAHAWYRHCIEENEILAKQAEQISEQMESFKQTIEERLNQLTPDYTDQKITVLYDDVCKSCQSVLTLLDLAGVQYEKKYVSLLKGDTSSPEFLKLNSQGKVPCLKIGNDLLIESASLMRFIATAFNLTDFYPTDPHQRSKIDEVLEIW